MTSGTRQGGRPTFFDFGLGKLGRGPRRGSVCAAAGLSLAMLMAGGDLAAQAQKIPYGMVPYGRPVYKNGKRILWHGVWRGGSLGRYARQSAAPAAARPMLALAPQPAQPVVAKEFTVLADPGDVRASRMAKDFATVISADGTPGRAIVGTTSPNGLGKVLKSDVADFAIVSLDSLLSSAKGDPEWMKRAPYVACLAPETMAVIASRDVKSISDLQGKTVSFGDLDSATSTSGRMLFSRLGVTATQTNEPLPEALDRLSAGKVDASSSARKTRPRLAILAAMAAFTSYPSRGRRLSSPSMLRLTSPRPTGPISSTRRFRSRHSASRWRWSRSTRPQDRRARMASAELRGSSLTIMTGSSPMSAIRTGVTSIWRPMPRGRPELGPDLGLHKVGWTRRNRPPTDRSIRSARRPSRPPHRPVGQARLIRIDFMKA
jgi:hypothetical protein